jgi:hypothetical protein
MNAAAQIHELDSYRGIAELGPGIPARGARQIRSTHRENDKLRGYNRKIIN